jgi:NADPH-dependent curcumin reductase CurA
MSESTTPQIVLAARPHGRPQADNFRLEQAAMPTTPSGRGVLICVLYLSLDPALHARRHGVRLRTRPIYKYNRVTDDHSHCCTRSSVEARTRLVGGNASGV